MEEKDCPIRLYCFDVFKDSHACLVGGSITEAYKLVGAGQTTFRKKVQAALDATRGSVAWLKAKGHSVRVRYDWERADQLSRIIEIYDEAGNVTDVASDFHDLERKENLTPGNGESWIRAMEEDPDILCHGHYYIKY